ncbi:MAG TPA: hypothetical protein VE955_10290 [Candidatus Dormibacteraeota bacterium]|jgi:hypothetical protein|nr:hypothetical protein [Candidatus Dormibacteraeota bacterium]
MGLVKWAKKTLDRNRRSRKAISTIMANLTMLVIVVVLSSLLFVWAISSFGAYQGGAGYWFSSRSLANQERISIEGAYLYCVPASCAPGSTSYALIYVRNVGTIPFTIASAYLNQTLYSWTPLVQYNVSQVEPVGIGPGLPSSYPGLCMTCLGQPLIHGSWTITVATQRGTVVSTTTVY